MVPSGVEIYIALEPVNMRLSFDRLAGLAHEQTGYDARSGALFIFFGRRRDSLKILFFDGTGMTIHYKRLDRHTFKIPEAPSADARYVEVDDAARGSPRWRRHRVCGRSSIAAEDALTPHAQGEIETRPAATITLDRGDRVS